MNNPNQPAKRMMLFCEPCGYKRILEAEELPKDLPEIKSCAVQTNIPTIDSVTNKAINVPVVDPKTKQLVNKSERPQPKKFKCPKCGRGVRLKELLKPFATALEKVDKEKELQRLEADKQQRLKDGIPAAKRPIDPNDPTFLG